MKLITICAAFVIALVFQGCVISGQGPKAAESRYQRLADSYNSRNPVREAEKDFKHGRYEIYSANSYSLYYPGLDFEVGGAVAEKFGVKHIEGTTDASESDGQREFNLAAYHFGNQYNQRKMQLLKDSGKLGR